MTTLDRLALHYGTDKASDGHNYTEQYVQYFEPLRQKKLVLVELGVGGHEDAALGGASLRMWRDYFPNATIVGVDIEAKNFTIDGVEIVQASQDDPAVAKSIFDNCGPIDIVIDDASHVSSLTIAAFKAYYPFIAPGGIYVCEDTHMAYHLYYGPDEANPNPDGKLLGGGQTLMQFARRLADEVNFHGNWESYDQGDLFAREFWLGYQLEWIHFYYNIFFAKKAWWAQCG